MCPLDKTLIYKDTLMAIIKENMFHNQKKYRPISILKWNITMEPEDISKYIRKICCV